MESKLQGSVEQFAKLIACKKREFRLLCSPLIFYLFYKEGIWLDEEPVLKTGNAVNTPYCEFESHTFLFSM